MGASAPDRAYERARRAAEACLAIAQDAEDRLVSVCRHLRRIFADLPPHALRDSEAAAALRALEGAYARVTGTTVAPDLHPMPHLHRLCAVLDRLRPGDLTALEAHILLMLLTPAHSRALEASTLPDGVGRRGRPVMRLVLAKPATAS